MRLASLHQGSEAESKRTNTPTSTHGSKRRSSTSLGHRSSRASSIRWSTARTSCVGAVLADPSVHSSGVLIEVPVETLWRGGVCTDQGDDDFKRRKLLTNTSIIIKLPLRPRKSTSTLISTRSCRSLGGSDEWAVNECLSINAIELGHLPEVGGCNSLESLLILVTRAYGLAGALVEDSSNFVVLRVRGVNGGPCEIMDQVIEDCEFTPVPELPLRLGLWNGIVDLVGGGLFGEGRVVGVGFKGGEVFGVGAVYGCQNCCGVGGCGGIRGPHELVDIATVVACFETVVDAIVWVLLSWAWWSVSHLGGDQAGGVGPFVDLSRPVDISRVASVLCHAGREEQEVHVGASVLVIVALVEGEHLPAQTTVTGCGVPACGLGIPNILDDVHPLLRIVNEFVFCGRQGGEGPVRLVVVADTLKLLEREEVRIIAALGGEAGGDVCLGNDGCVVGEMDVVGQDGPVEPGLPPPVGVADDAEEVVLEWVVFDEVLDDLGGGSLDGCLNVLEYAQVWRLYISGARSGEP